MLASAGPLPLMVASDLAGGRP